MDIAKIRKKALSADAEKKTAGKPVSAPAEEEIKEREKESRPAGGETIAVQEPAPEETPASRDTRQPDRAPDDEGTGEAAEELVELLIFRLSREEYAFRVTEVEEILRFQKIARVPTMPDHVLGITSLRGKIIPVIDLKTRLNLQEKSPAAVASPDVTRAEQKNKDGMKILILSGPNGLIGASIDSVMGVVRLPLNAILQPPGHLDEKELKFIEGIIVLEKRFISIIHSESALDMVAS